MKTTKRTRPVPRATPVAPAPQVAPPPPAAPPPVQKRLVDGFPELQHYARGIAGCGGPNDHARAIDCAMACNACCSLLVAGVGAFAAALVDARVLELVQPATPTVEVGSDGAARMRMPVLRRRVNWLGAVMLGSAGMLAAVMGMFGGNAVAAGGAGGGGAR